MLRFEVLPKLTFIDDEGAERCLVLKESAPRVRAVARHLGARVERGAAVGLMYRTGPELVVAWLACLAAGLRPLIMQYPTAKQSREYWRDSVQNTIAVASVALIVSDEECYGRGLPELSATIAQHELDGLAEDGGGEPLVLDDFAILQLSSGTTGYRKALQFDSAALRRHVADFNATLELSANDKIVSWLPLYHDMGYIACFVMPMMLGIEVVMMDPMTWVKRPELLYDAIERHAGTVCYMPNFGFEVMARCGRRRLASLRWWISCSEPVSALTARKFLDAVGAEDWRFAPCYAMAENIFAVTVRRGLESRAIEAAQVVSCGRPIAGVELKLVEGEIWVRSPTSLASYLGGDDIRDSEGYYPSGDLGEIIEGELYVTGRKQDLLIQAGRKFMLSDIDLVFNRLYPQAKGRAAAVSIYDERLGTQKPVMLVESLDFFRRRDQVDVATALGEAIGLDQIEVHFVPPRFLTKTSSGKFNRKKSAADWLGHCQAGAPRAAAVDPVAEIRDSFRAVDWDRPIAEVLDSLSSAVLRIILSETAVAFDDTASLNQLVERLASGVGAPAVVVPSHEVIRIVSLADRPHLEPFNEAHLDRLAEKLGAPVVMEHLCLPPSPILLSDLVFHDYFQPRLDQAPFAAVDRAFAKLRSASALLVDDISEFYFPPDQDYAVLSHNLESDPRADLIAVRWQRYPQYHPELPRTVVSGLDLPLETRAESLDLLASYVDKPIFRIATFKAFRHLTEGWELRASKPSGYLYGPDREPVISPDDFIERFADWAARLDRPLRRYPFTGGSRLERSDFLHYCSKAVKQEPIDRLLARYGSFYVVGVPASVPYIRKKLDRLGKPYVQVPSYAREIIDHLPERYECVLICGAGGPYELDIPAEAIIFVWQGGPDLNGKAFRDRVPRSGADWFWPFDGDPARSRDAVRNAKQAAQEEAKVLREELREERRRARKAKTAQARRLAASEA